MMRLLFVTTFVLAASCGGGPPSNNAKTPTNAPQPQPALSSGTKQFTLKHPDYIVVGDCPMMIDTASFHGDGTVMCRAALDDGTCGDSSTENPPANLFTIPGAPGPYTCTGGKLCCGVEQGMGGQLTLTTH